MSSQVSATKALPFVAGIVLMAVIAIGVKSCSKETQVTSLGALPVPGTPDADSVNNTVKTLVATVEDLKSHNIKISTQNKELINQRQAIESSVKAQLSEEMKRENANNSASLTDSLSKRFNFLTARIDEMTVTQNKASEAGGDDIPIGFGVNNQDLIAAEKQPEYIWVEPLGTGENVVSQAGGSLSDESGFGQSLLHDNSKANGTDNRGIDEDDSLQKKIASMKDKPVYTVPRNSTLLGSKGMTALIGRVPIAGSVEDAFPFKVIVGKDNLAANNITMPGLDGMIFSGKATGDWTLSCVRGKVHSVTYVFDDGTVRTLSSDDTGGESKLAQGGSSQGQDSALGWISDRRGVPCVTGVRITNTGSYLAGRVLASAAEAAAEAFSQGEVTNSVSALGGVATSVITGDAMRFAGGKALSGSASEVSDYLRERQARSFDVVYVDTGADISVHIDIELPIDYEYNGRKTSYEITENSEYNNLD